MQFLDGILQRRGQVGAGLQLVIEQMDDDLGIGIGHEYVAQRLELAAQRFMVFDDAVVHHGQVTAGHMRVGIALARRAVGGPAGMRDAQPADQRSLLLRLLEFGNLARAPQALQLAMAVQHGQAGAVVTAVLQALEASRRMAVMLRSAMAPTMPHMINSPAGALGPRRSV